MLNKYWQWIRQLFNIHPFVCRNQISMKAFSLVFLSFLLTAGLAFSQDKPAGLPDKYDGDWFNLSPEQNDVYGISVNEAYKYFNDLELQPVIVAVIDDGVDISHPDLEGKLWKNSNEIPDNGIDDDGNGYIDDVYGWNYLGNPNGENIEHENVEIVRLYRPLKERFENVNPESVSKADKSAYKEYLAYKEAYEEKINELNEEYSQYAQLAALYQGATAYMKEQLKTEDLTINDLLMYEPESEDDGQVRDFLVMAEQEGLNQYLLDNDSYFESSIKYHYNIDYNPRSIVNEDWAAQNNTAYGNNMVWAGEPDHGTHVAGIIGAVRHNDDGMNGIAKNARIMSLRVVPDGDERDKDIALAIRYAVDNGAKVINMSFGKDYSPNEELVHSAVKYASANDVLLIHAAGNDAENNDKIGNYPDGTLGKRKSYDNWITVGASGPLRDTTFIAEFSNYGKKSVDILAPGVEILSLVSGGGVDSYSGTSMAAPVVSGLATVLRGAYPNISAKEIKKIILQSADIDKKLRVAFIGDDLKLKKLIRNPGTPSLFMALVLAKVKTGS